MTFKTRGWRNSAWDWETLCVVWRSYRTYFFCTYLLIIKVCDIYTTCRECLEFTEHYKLCGNRRILFRIFKTSCTLIWSQLAQTLCFLPRLRNCGLTSVSIQFLTSALKTNPRLTELHLMGNNLKDSAIRGLMALTKNQKYPLQTIEWVLYFEEEKKHKKIDFFFHPSCSLVIVKQQNRLIYISYPVQTHSAAHFHSQECSCSLSFSSYLSASQQIEKTGRKQMQGHKLPELVHTPNTHSLIFNVL